MSKFKLAQKSDSGSTGAKHWPQLFRRYHWNYRFKDTYTPITYLNSVLPTMTLRLYRRASGIWNLRIKPCSLMARNHRSNWLHVRVQQSSISENWAGSQRFRWTLPTVLTHASPIPKYHYIMGVEKKSQRAKKILNIPYQKPPKTNRVGEIAVISVCRRQRWPPKGMCVGMVFVELRPINCIWKKSHRPNGRTQDNDSPMRGWGVWNGHLPDCFRFGSWMEISLGVAWQVNVIKMSTCGARVESTGSWKASQYSEI